MCPSGLTSVLTYGSDVAPLSGTTGAYVGACGVAYSAFQAGGNSRGRLEKGVGGVCVFFAAKRYIQYLMRINV